MARNKILWPVISNYKQHNSTRIIKTKLYYIYSHACMFSYKDFFKTKGEILKRSIKEDGICQSPWDWGCRCRAPSFILYNMKYSLVFFIAQFRHPYVTFKLIHPHHQWRIFGYGILWPSRAEKWHYYSISKLFMVLRLKIDINHSF